MTNISHWAERRVVSLKNDPDGHDGKPSIAIYVNGSPIITGLSREYLLNAIKQTTEGDSNDDGGAGADSAGEVGNSIESDPED